MLLPVVETLSPFKSTPVKVTPTERSFFFPVAFRTLTVAVVCGDAKNEERKKTQADLMEHNWWQQWAHVVRQRLNDSKGRTAKGGKKQHKIRYLRSCVCYACYLMEDVIYAAAPGVAGCGSACRRPPFFD